MKHLETSLPLIDEDDLELITLPHISMNAIVQFYSKVEELENGVVLYHNNVSGGYISGKTLGNDFVPFVSITCKKPGYPGANIPSQLTDWVQVAMVNVDKLLALYGYTRLTYQTLAKHVDLVSDRKQYWAAKKLWQSLARSSGTHIYVYDGNIKDYLRDSKGSPRKYDGKNISENIIWGKTTEHAKRLLVATTKQLI